MAGYATLQEAYNIESFNVKKKKEGFKNKEKIQEKFMNDYSSQDDCYFKKEFGINNDTCILETNNNPKYGNFVPNEPFTNNNSDVKDYKSNTMNTQGNTCSPLQVPNYNLPISEENKAEFKKVVDLYTNYQSNNISYNEFNKNKESNDIMPYYDEDMDQYLDINTLKTSKIFTGTSGTEIIPNNRRYMPNYNEKGYTDDNTDKYLNINTKTEDILVSPPYNLSEEDKKNSLKALNILKRFQTDAPVIKEYTSNTNNTSNTDNKNNTDNVNYNSYYNIALFIFIGIVIILLCDQIAELAINLGMKRATQILEPYLNKPNTDYITEEISNSNIPNIIDEVPVLPVLPSSPELSIIDIYKNSNVK